MTAPDFGSVDVLVGDCRETVKTLAPGSIHCVVTSPPYWGLRDYGTGRWEGGDPACAHRRANLRPDHSRGELTGRGEQPRAASSASPMGARCALCGAARVDDAQIGLEPSIGDYIATLVALFDDVRTALRDDGTVWLNLGDTFTSDGGVRLNAGLNDGPKRQALADRLPSRLQPEGLKQKDKALLPHRVAIALQDAGWYVRQDNVWSKPNPLPEAVKDRPSTSHEYVFQLSKCETYYYDRDAVKEPTTGGAHPRGQGRNPKAADPSHAVGRVRANSSFQDAIGDLVDTRNLRSVWTIPTQPYSGAHFATFPEELARRCVLAGCPVGGRVLDPFGGSGTVAAVALPLGRSATLLELHPAFADMARARVEAAVEAERRRRAQLSLLPAEPPPPPRPAEPEQASFFVSATVHLGRGPGRARGFRLRIEEDPAALEDGDPGALAGEPEA